MRKQRSSSESGSALVETALTLPVLIVLILGALEFGRVASAAVEITNAAKAAAAYGAQSRATVTDTPGIQEAAVAEVDPLAGLRFATTDVHSAVWGRCASLSPCTGRDSGAGPICTTSDCSATGDHIEAVLTVNTSGTIDPLIHLPGFPSQYTVHGKAVQTVLQP